MNDGLRFRGEMRDPRFEIVSSAMAVGQIQVALHRHKRAQTSVNLGTQQSGQSGAVNSIAHAIEETAPAYFSICFRPLDIRSHRLINIEESRRIHQSVAE